jgi:hypothetical protein
LCALLAASAGAACAGKQLPALARTRAGIVAFGDEARSVESDDIEPMIFEVLFVGAEHLRRDGVAAAARDQYPIVAARGSRRIFDRLESRAVVRDEIAPVMDFVLTPELDDR